MSNPYAEWPAVRRQNVRATPEQQREKTGINLEENSIYHEFKYTAKHGRSCKEREIRCTLDTLPNILAKSSFCIRLSAGEPLIISSSLKTHRIGTIKMRWPRDISCVATIPFILHEPRKTLCIFRYFSDSRLPKSQALLLLPESSSFFAFAGLMIDSMTSTPAIRKTLAKPCNEMQGSYGMRALRWWTAFLLSGRQRFMIGDPHTKYLFTIFHFLSRTR